MKVTFDLPSTTNHIHKLIDKALYQNPTLRSLYHGTDHKWVEESVWIDRAITDDEKPLHVYSPEYKAAGEALLTLGKTLADQRTRSSFLRFIGAVCGRHLDILAQLECVNRAVKDATLIHISPGRNRRKPGKPQKEHTVHAACVLEAGRYLLSECSNVNGQPVWSVLYKAILTSLKAAFPNFPHGEFCNHLEGAGASGPKQFIEDCWLATVLAHDNGYLPMIELNLRRARGGDWIGPLMERNSRLNDLKGWLGRTIEQVHKELQQDWGMTEDVRLLLTNLEQLGLQHDDEYREKPAAVHGAVSGYQLLDYLLFTSTKTGQSPWKYLNLVEKAMAVVVAGASIFHTADIAALCRTKCDDEHLQAERLRNFEDQSSSDAFRKPIKESLERGFSELMNYNPMGVFLYAVDSLEEWVRPTWHTIYPANAGSFGVFDSEYGQTFGLTNRLAGLTAIIGQCPVTTSHLEVKKTAKSLRVVYLKPVHHNQLHVVKLEEEQEGHKILSTPGDYDYDRLTGDLQKDGLLPAALKALTGYNVKIEVRPSSPASEPEQLSTASVQGTLFDSDGAEQPLGVQKVAEALKPQSDEKWRALQHLDLILGEIEVASQRQVTRREAMRLRESLIGLSTVAFRPFTRKEVEEELVRIRE
jgi:hypothetical protein